uniref:Phage protein n=1 Tax=Dulem virus 36 TaxID=3145754 RepID=A0AAU8B148_9CAUD
MFVNEKLFERIFEGETTKEAYMNACKWLASNVIAVNNMEYIQCKFIKVDKGYTNYAKSIRLEVYAMLEEKEEFEHFCKVCKEAGNLFYSVEDKYRCYNCKLKPYRDRVKQDIDRRKDYIKGVLDV